MMRMPCADTSPATKRSRNSLPKNIVTHQHCDLEGLLITLKIGDYGAAKLIDEWTAKINEWQPSRVRVRQLSRNKVEVCFAVTM